MSEGNTLFGLQPSAQTNESEEDQGCLVPVLHEEYEVKLELPATLGPVDLSGVGHLGASLVHHLHAVYFDTPTLDLARSGSTLRRRSGGTDAGWHLKIKGSEPSLRHEYQGPIHGARPPAALRQILPEGLANAPLIPVMRMNTTRVETPLLDSSRRTVALISDDTVRVGRPDPHDPDLEHGAKEWREIEVEYVSGDVGKLTEIEEVLVAQGARPARYASKLERALEEVGVRPSYQEQAEGNDSLGGLTLSAGDVIMGFISEQAGTIQAFEDAVTVDAPDAVHKVRVATRRLRSALQSYASLFDADAASGLVKMLRRELRWYAGALGLARDGEVLLDHIHVYADQIGMPEQTPELVAFLQFLQDRHDAARDVVIEAVRSPRYEELQDELSNFLADPPLSADADISARRALFGLAARPIKAVYDDYLVALQGPGPGNLWHEVRKRGKRVRYFMDALKRAYPAASESATAWEAVTDVLGEAQDAHVAAEALEDFLTLSPSVQGSLSPLREYMDYLMYEKTSEGASVVEDALAFAVIH